MENSTRFPPFFSDAADLLKRLLRRNVDRRLSTASAVKSHPFFASIDWKMVVQKAYQPPHIPNLDLKNDADLSQFDPRFTSRSPKESESKSREKSDENSENEEEGEETVFGDFDYISPECQNTLEDEIRLTLQELHIRGHGE